MPFDGFVLSEILLNNIYFLIFNKYEKKEAIYLDIIDRMKFHLRRLRAQLFIGQIGM
jgi:hypothetical protein